MEKDKNKGKNKEVKVRKGRVNINKYEVLDDYLSLKLSVREIALKYNTSEPVIDTIISNIYKNLLKVRESRMLIASGGNPKYYEILHKRHLDPSQVNKEFLESLSDPDSPYMTDEEIIFCHTLADTGDSATAIDRSGLYQGIRRGTGTNCKELMRIRADYLKRKPNIVQYLQTLQKERLDIVKEGKEYIQSSLIAQIEQLKAREDAENDTKILKALETLGRTVGAFEDKSTIEVVTGDSALDKILEKAKAAKEANGNKNMLAYSSEDGGIEIYE